MYVTVLAEKDRQSTNFQIRDNRRKGGFRSKNNFIDSARSSSNEICGLGR